MEKVTVEEVKAFVADAEKAREYWLRKAKQSWNELKKRGSDGKLWNASPSAPKKKQKYPAWWSIFKIRQPLILSRIGIPIGRDTTQDGMDNIGATAAILLERCAKNVAASFDFFDVMCSGRDDCLATNFGSARAYYEKEDVKERVKKPIQPMKMPDTGDVIFVDEAGREIESDDIVQDDQGQFFYETDEVVDVVNEKICLEHVEYHKMLIDPDVTRWSKVRRIAFEVMFSEREFKHVFGIAAWTKLAIQGQDTRPGGRETNSKKQNVKVYEYWDMFSREVVWLPENGPEFVTPKGYEPEEYGDGEQLNGLYNLDGFFPCPEPLIINQTTDEFWPIPEFYQLQEVFEDIHTIFTRMVACTRAVRARLLFDSNVEGLEEALHEASEGDALGVSNLTQALIAAGGSLENVAQYIPTQKLIESLNNLYIALEQRLNTVYKLTGTSDLLQGLVTDPTQRTYGERQMTEKYALNQVAELQRKMAEYVRGCYQLLAEMALKNFKPETLKKYLMPETLPPEKQAMYAPALNLLLDDSKRFRIELETDSTVQLNEEYDKRSRIELVNALTAALEKVAQIAQGSPALVAVELHCLKFLVQGFRQGKLFQSEITQAIDGVIKQAEEAAQSAKEPFNKDAAMAQIKQAELELTKQLKIYEIQSRERLEAARINSDGRIKGVENQIEMMRMNLDAGKAQSEAQTDRAKMQADMMLALQELQLKRDALLVDVQKIQNEKQRDEFRASLDALGQQFDQQIRAAEQQLEQVNSTLALQERIATEQRLQAEHKLSEIETLVRTATMVKEIQQPMEPPQVNVSLPPFPAPGAKRRRHSIKYDQAGNIAQVMSEDEDLLTPGS